MSCSDSPKIAYVTLGFILSGALLLLIGFATPQWITSGDFYEGLWQSCSPAGCQSALSEFDTTRDKISRAFACIALVFAVGTVVAALAFIRIIPIMKTRQKVLAYVMSTGCSMTSICISVSIYTFGFNSGYSYILSSCVSPCFIVAWVLSIILARNVRPEPDVHPQGSPEDPEDTGPSG